MDVQIMRVTVDQRLVHMNVAVRFSWRVAVPVRVLVVLVMMVQVLVLDSGTFVLMLVPLCHV